MGLMSQICGMNMHYKRYTPESFFKAQQKFDITKVEFWISAPHFYLDAKASEDASDIKRLAQRHGISIPVVTTSSSAWQYQYAMHAEREACLNYFTRGIKTARALGASIMTVNSGWGFLTDDTDAFSRSAEMLYALSEVAERNDIQLAMESLTPYETKIAYNIETTKLLWQHVNHPALQLMVDTVAMAKGGDTLEEWFQTFGRHIIHMHFIDWLSSEPADTHLAWGDGDASLESLLRICDKYHYTGLFSQEISARGSYFADPIAVDKRNYARLKEAIITIET